MFTHCKWVPSSKTVFFVVLICCNQISHISSEDTDTPDVLQDSVPPSNSDYDERYLKELELATNGTFSAPGNDQSEQAQVSHNAITSSEGDVFMPYVLRDDVSVQSELPEAGTVAAEVEDKSVSGTGDQELQKEQDTESSALSTSSEDLSQEAKPVDEGAHESDGTKGSDGANGSVLPVEESTSEQKTEARIEVVADEVQRDNVDNLREDSDEELLTDETVSRLVQLFRALKNHDLRFKGLKDIPLPENKQKQGEGEQHKDGSHHDTDKHGDDKDHHSGSGSGSDHHQHQSSEHHHSSHSNQSTDSQKAPHELSGNKGNITLSPELQAMLGPDVGKGPGGVPPPGKPDDKGPGNNPPVGPGSGNLTSGPGAQVPPGKPEDKGGPPPPGPVNVPPPVTGPGGPANVTTGPGIPPPGKPEDKGPGKGPGPEIGKLIEGPGNVTAGPGQQKPGPGPGPSPVPNPGPGTPMVTPQPGGSGNASSSGEVIPNVKLPPFCEAKPVPGPSKCEWSREAEKQLYYWKKDKPRADVSGCVGAKRETEADCRALCEATPTCKAVHFCLHCRWFSCHLLNINQADFGEPATTQLNYVDYHEKKACHP